MSNWGISLGLCVLPSKSAEIASTEHIPTNTNASRTDTAELCLNDSGMSKTTKKGHLNWDRDGAFYVTKISTDLRGERGPMEAK